MPLLCTRVCQMVGTRFIHLKYIYIKYIIIYVIIHFAAKNSTFFFYAWHVTVQEYLQTRSCYMMALHVHFSSCLHHKGELITVHQCYKSLALHINNHKKCFPCHHKTWSNVETWKTWKVLYWHKGSLTHHTLLFFVFFLFKRLFGTELLFSTLVF